LFFFLLPVSIEVLSICTGSQASRSPTRGGSYILLFVTANERWFPELPPSNVVNCTCPY
jgi:hypothetical protein